MNNIIVFQSDFGLVDGAVSAMHGVSKQVSIDLELEDLTHDIPQFNTWEASYRLLQTVKFWPEETTFVSVVDPGVGSIRKSVVARTKNNMYIVTPDNGTLTHLKTKLGIVEVREIDESVNRLKGSEESHTFHGRDVYAYTAARLASEQITFEQVGPLLNVEDIIELPMNKPTYEDGKLIGSIDILDTRYGSVWSNISLEFFKESGFDFGGEYRVQIIKHERVLYSNIVKFARGFSEVEFGEGLLYVNSVLTIGLAINQGNFSRAYNIKPSKDSELIITKM